MNQLRSVLNGLLILVSFVFSERIDTHIHALPPAYLNALAATGGDPSGYPTPEWSLDAAIKSMNAIGTSLGKRKDKPNRAEPGLHDVF